MVLWGSLFVCLCVFVSLCPDVLLFQMRKSQLTVGSFLPVLLSALPYLDHLGFLFPRNSSPTQHTSDVLSPPVPQTKLSCLPKVDHWRGDLADCLSTLADPALTLSSASSAIYHHISTLLAIRFLFFNNFTTILFHPVVPLLPSLSPTLGSFATMAPGKVTGPSHFCEWVIGTTIPSALGPVPKQKKPRHRDVFRIEVTTDDESEEDTLRITYPRTGRTKSTHNNPVSNNPDSTVKKVRFDENTKAAPKKSALKKTKPPVDSDETSESGAELDSSQSSRPSDSEAESSDDAPKPAAKGKKQQKKQKASSDDTDSECDSDPHPTCKCQRCANGRQKLGRGCQRCAKQWSDNDTETSESEADNPPPKGKKQTPTNGKKNGGKKTKESETDAETSDSSKETSGSEPQKSPKAKTPAKNKPVQKKKEAKSEESNTDAETSESEPEAPSKAKKQEAVKSNKKTGGKQTNASDTDGETSESAKDTDEDSKPAKKNNSINGKSGSGKENGQKKQTQKQKKKSSNEANRKDEDKKEENTPVKEKGKSKKEKKIEESGKESSKKLKHKDGAKKGNYPEALPYPHPRRPNLIEPIRAEVVQTERVVETPEDPAPNAFYDQEHNIVRVYYGPVYGNHHGNALYPSRTVNTQPLPMGIPHPTQNPYYYGFNNQQQPQQQPPPPPQGYGYTHVPITQGVPPGPWNAIVPPPGFPAGYTGQPINQLNAQEMQAGGGAYMMSGGAGFPPSSKDKDKDGVNNVGPEEPKNPYLPQRPKSQFSTYGSAGRRNASRETRNSGKGGDRVPSNTGWTNNDGAGEQQGTWGNGAPKTNEWDQSNNSQKEQDAWGGSAKNSNRSNDSAQKKQGAHWDEDTHLQSKYGSSTWDPRQDRSGENDNNAVGWDNDQSKDDKGNSIPGGNVMPGSWVETTTPTPAWGDPSAAADTGGRMDKW